MIYFKLVGKSANYQNCIGTFYQQVHAITSQPTGFVQRSWHCFQLCCPEYNLPPPSVGTTVFRGKFCQIPRRHLPNSAAHRSKFLEFRGSPWPPTLESLCRLWPSYKFIIINSSTARIYWCKICNKIWINFSLFFVKTVILMTRDDWVISKVNVKTRHWNRQASVAVCEWTESHNYNYNSNTELQNLVVPRNFLEFREIPRKHGNSAATAKFRGSARNSAVRGKLWSLLMTFLGRKSVDG